MLRCFGCVWLPSILFIGTHSLALVETDLAKLCFLYGKMHAMDTYCRCVLRIASLLSIHCTFELGIFLHDECMYSSKTRNGFNAVWMGLKWLLIKCCVGQVVASVTARQGVSCSIPGSS
ncbi:hypothetical protein SFRURICE_007524, partial [Spodoptera frugiperda]